MSRIRYQLVGVNIFDKSDWEKINEFFVNNLPAFEGAFKDYINILK